MYPISSNFYSFNIMKRKCEQENLGQEEDIKKGVNTDKQIQEPVILNEGQKRAKVVSKDLSDPNSVASSVEIVANSSAGFWFRYE